MEEEEREGSHEEEVEDGEGQREEKRKYSEEREDFPRK